MAIHVRQEVLGNEHLVDLAPARHGYVQALAIHSRADKHVGFVNGNALASVHCRGVPKLGVFLVVPGWQGHNMVGVGVTGANVASLFVDAHYRPRVAVFHELAGLMSVLVLVVVSAGDNRVADVDGYPITNLGRLAGVEETIFQVMTLGDLVESVHAVVVCGNHHRAGSTVACLQPAGEDLAW